MILKEMTATFGKLEGETLTLKPGLNIIEAPNEWGKSTWCAFLLAMLYGIDTRAKTTKTQLADKDHYEPWSGKPMSGRMIVHWQGRDITIERSTRGRIPLGEFSAYETESGLPVRELTAENCGEKLLGVEQAVFKRAGFIRLSDLPVTRDDALCRRLNALVTTGDESGDGEHLARALKALQNKCRYNKTGLLPQAEEALAQAAADLQELQNLQMEADSLEEKKKNGEEELLKLQNHRTHLQNQEASADAGRVKEAKDRLEAAEKNREKLEKVCEKLPELSHLQKKEEQLQKLSRTMDALLEEERQLPRVDPPPAAPAVFHGMSPQESVDMALRDQEAREFWLTNFTIVWVLAGVCAAAGAAICFALEKSLGGILCILLAGGFLAAGFYYQKLRLKKIRMLTEKYGDENPDNWLLKAKFYLQAAASYEKDSGKDRGRRVEIGDEIDRLRKQQEAICGDRTLSETIQKLQKMIKYREALEAAKKEVSSGKIHLQAVMAMAKTARKPEDRDDLFYTEEETLEKIEALQTQQQELLTKMGQYQGRMEALGTEAQLREKEKKLRLRIQKLTETWEALNLAQETLQQVTGELQRRFAPRITSRAQELMGKMTGGRYEKLTLQEDFSLKTGAESEPVLHSARWRSEGTIDQLYLSLRLAVARELTAEAPLILDDALVRFDEVRLQQALQILREEGKQVLLFTCQSREGNLLPEMRI